MSRDDVSRLLPANTFLDAAARARYAPILHWLTQGLVVFALAMLSAFHTVTVFGAPFTRDDTVFFVVAVLPAVLTMVLVPGAWRHPVRWLLVLAAMLITAPGFTAGAVIAVETWALYRSWVLESGWGKFRSRVAALVHRREGPV